jgi:hypothetical protein
MGMGIKSRPPLLLVAAVVLAAEALALFAYTLITVIETATNDAYQVSNGVAQIVLQLIMLAGLALLASGVLKLRPWTRTPAVMVQVIIGFVGVVLLQAHRWDWGVPTLLLAVAGLVSLLTPASLKALARPMPPRDQPQQGQPKQEHQQKQKQQRQQEKTGASGKSGNPAKRNPTRNPASNPATNSDRNSAGKPVSRRS